MPGDPKECRQHALNCVHLAKGASTPEQRDHFAKLARTWIKLAEELEQTEAFLAAIEDERANEESRLKGKAPVQGGALRLLLLYALLARVIPNPARFLTVLLVIGCGRRLYKTSVPGRNGAGRSRRRGQSATIRHVSRCSRGRNRGDHNLVAKCHKLTCSVSKSMSALCQKRTSQKLSASDVRPDWARAIIPSHVIAIWLSPIE